MPRGPRSGCWGSVFTDWAWPRALWAPRSGRPTLPLVLEVLSLDLTDPGADTGAEASSSLGSPPVQPMGVPGPTLMVPSGGSSQAGEPTWLATGHTLPLDPCPCLCPPPLSACLPLGASEGVSDSAHGVGGLGEWGHLRVRLTAPTVCRGMGGWGHGDKRPLFWRIWMQTALGQ